MKNAEQSQSRCCRIRAYSVLVKNCALVTQLVEHQAVMQEVVSSTPARPTLRVIKITEEKVLPL